MVMVLAFGRLLLQTSLVQIIIITITRNISWLVCATMARHNSTPSHVAYVYLVLVMANSFMARPIQRKLHTMTYVVGNERSKRHGRTTRISTISCFLRSPWFTTVGQSSCLNCTRSLNSVENKLKFHYLFLHSRCGGSRHKMFLVRRRVGVLFDNGPGSNQRYLRQN